MENKGFEFPSVEINRIIKDSKMSVSRDLRNGKTIVKDSLHFKGMPDESVRQVMDIVDGYSKNMYERVYGATTTREAARTASFNRVYDVVTQANSRKQLDSLKAVDIFKALNKDSSPVGAGGISNNLLGIGTPGSVYNQSKVTPNIWISPWDANALYSQGGLAKIIIDKKSKTILSNGLKIKNARLSPKQLDLITAEAVRLGIPKIISDAARDSLVYGGSVVFPMFKKDNPATMALDISTLVKMGVVGKGCIERFITLDRWNAMIIPPINPVQKDYLNPDKYIIPFLGADVNGQRVSRVVVNAQSGWIGNAMTLGWGNSDYLGYCKQLINYDLSMQAIPVMINQMSILVRQINLDPTLAMEGCNVIDDLSSSAENKIREATPDNPIQMDIIGELKSIDRDFGDVPELLRMERQELCAAAQIPEPLLFSSTRGAFSDNDDIQGNMNKQYESLSHYHKGIELAFKHLAQLLIIHTLGTDKSIIEALPYTQIHFDVPVINDPVDRAKVAELIGEALFKTASSQIPIPIATEMVSNLIGDELTISSDFIDEIKEVQENNDRRAEEKHQKEMELMDAQIEATKEKETMGEGVSAPKLEGKPKEEGGDDRNRKYTPMEQKQHEKVKVGNVHMNAMARSKNKINEPKTLKKA